MNADPNGGLAGWSQRVLQRWLDSDYQIRPHALLAERWAALPVADSMNPMEAEWLAEAMKGQGATAAVGLAFEYGGNASVEEVTPDRDRILAFNGSNSWRYVVITPDDQSFVYYKDEANRFYLLCGQPAFVSQAYRCTWETARVMYFDHWVDLEHHSAEEKHFMTKVWNKYAQVRPA